MNHLKQRRFTRINENFSIISEWWSTLTFLLVFLFGEETVYQPTSNNHQDWLLWGGRICVCLPVIKKKSSSPTWHAGSHEFHFILEIHYKISACRERWVFFSKQILTWISGQLWELELMSIYTLIITKFETQNVRYFAKIWFMMAKHRCFNSKTSMHSTYFFSRMNIYHS